MSHFNTLIAKSHQHIIIIMSSSGRTYEVTGQTTEWDDILIKKGIRTKEEILLEKGLNPADVRESVCVSVFLSLCTDPL
jgi:hypothetical protein